MRRVLRVLVLLALARCAPVDLLNASVLTRGVSVARDIGYGENPRQRLDIYSPVDAGGKRPVVVFFYGGNWRNGSKSLYPFVAQVLARRGIVVVVPDYRLYPEVQFPLFLEDCARAVAWTLSHAERYGGDPGRVTLIGHSAGAYNAVMLGLDPKLLEAYGADRHQLAGIIGLAGPYDFLPITDPDTIPVFATVQDGPASQPVSYVDGRNPPMLLLTGDSDRTVRPRNTLSLARRIRGHGGTVETKIYPGVGHVGIILAFAPLFRSRAPVLVDVVSFVMGEGR
jgi:acetyl esterase/lipase